MIVVNPWDPIAFLCSGNKQLQFEIWKHSTIYNTIALQKWEILWYKSYTIHIGSKNRTSQNTGRRSQRKYKEKDILCSCVCAESLQSCPALCSPMRCNLLGSPVHMVLQARVLVWVSMPFSRGSSWLRNPSHISQVSCIGRWIPYHYGHLGKPSMFIGRHCCQDGNAFQIDL